MNYTIRLSVADNGFILSYDDPEVRKRNSADSVKGWEDPERQKVYSDFDQLVEDVPRILGAMRDYMESDEGKTSDFSEALSTAMDE